ncbi:MAG: permease [Planctomycetota bacterium]
MLTATWHIWLQLAPWLLLGAAVAGVLHAVLPPGFLRRRLSGNRGVVNAVLLGVPLPLCSCGVIPTGLGLKKQGASDGATVGFLISTPQTGVDSVLVTSAMIGLPFALFKVACAAATGLVGGWLSESMAKPTLPIIESSPNPTATGRRFQLAVEHAIELIRSIWVWLIVGVVISAGLTVWLPADGLGGLSGYGGIPGMLAALVISLPLYVCATASVPIASSLVAAGVPAGAAMVFLMAGPATNVATIGAVYRALGGRLLAVYLSTIIVGSIAGGLAFGWLIETPEVGHATHRHEPSTWVVACGVALATLILVFAIQGGRRWLLDRQPQAAEPDLSIGVEGMTCGGCVSKLQRALEAEPAIRSAHVVLTPGRAEVTGSITRERLGEIIQDAGFSPVDQSPPVTPS